MNYTGNPAGPIILTAPLPDDGVTKRKAESVNVPIQAALDNDAYINAHGYGSGLGLGADWIHVPLGYPLNPDADWTDWNFDKDLGMWVQVTTGGTIELWWPIPTLFRGRIVEMQAIVGGSDGQGAANHVAMPTKPTLTFYRVDHDAGAAIVQVATATDPSPDVGTYDTRHEIPLAGLTENVGPGLVYYVKFTGESGANALPDELALWAIRYRMTRLP